MSYLTDIKGVESSSFTGSGTLGAGGAFPSASPTGEDVLRYTQINVMVYVDEDSATNGLSLEFSTDNTNWDQKYTYTIFGNQTKTYSLPVLAQYFRVVYTNGSTAGAAYRVETIYHNTKNSNTFGEIVNGGSTNVVVLGSKSAFGEQLVAQTLPLAEMEFVYGINTRISTSLVRGSGSSVTSSNNMVELSTGTDADGLSEIQTNEVCNYHPGQGVDVRFTAVFDTAVAGSTQIAGVGNEDNGYFFGYNGTSFGILRRTSQIRQIVRFTLTAVATEIPIVTLNSVDTVLPALTATTLSGAAHEIAEAKTAGGASTFLFVGGGWDVFSSGNDVIFVATTAGARGDPTSGTEYSIKSQAPATGISATLNNDGIVGAYDAGNDNWTPSTSWNVDKADGTGLLPNMTFTLGNVFQIRYQWLGFGAISYGIENPLTGEFQVVHVDRYANTSTTTSIANPKLPLFAQAKKSSGASDVVLRVACMAGLLTGQMPVYIPTGHSISNSVTYASPDAVTGTDYLLLAVRNQVVYNGAINTLNADITIATMFNGSGKSAEYKFIVGGYKEPVFDITGDVTWSDVDSSLVQAFQPAPPTSATDMNVTGGTREYGLISGSQGNNLGNTIIVSQSQNFNVRLRPGQILAVVVNMEALGELSATLNWVDVF